MDKPDAKPEKNSNSSPRSPHTIIEMPPEVEKSLSNRTRISSGALGAAASLVLIAAKGATPELMGLGLLSLTIGVTLMNVQGGNWPNLEDSPPSRSLASSVSALVSTNSSAKLRSAQR